MPNGRNLHSPHKFETILPIKLGGNKENARRLLHNILAWGKEGTEIAQWFNSIGVTGILLKYRLPRRDKEQPHKAPLQDAQRAIRLARKHADAWAIDPQRVGIHRPVVVENPAGRAVDVGRFVVLRIPQGSPRRSGRYYLCPLDLSRKAARPQFPSGSVPLIPPLQPDLRTNVA